MIIAVGSTNKTKTDPVREIFSKHFNDVHVVGVKVSSGVDDQPMNDEVMFKGALNRAKESIRSVKDAEYGVGIEGGLHERSFGWFEHSIVVITDNHGKTGIGSSGGLVLPDKVVDRIKNGETLEQAIDHLFGTTKIGEGIGMFVIMTKGVVTRSQGVAHGVAFALAPFLHPTLY